MAKLVASQLTWCLRRSVRYWPRGAQSGIFLPSQSSACVQRRFYTADVIPPVAFEGEEKRYAPKIQQLVNDISQLTLLEVADLNELLKKTLKIADTPMMAVGAMSAPAKSKDEDSEAQEVKQEKVNFTVKLTKFDETKKVALIKEVKNLVHGMNLVQAKKFVESLPQLVRADVPKEEAEKLKAALEAVGATVVLD